MREISQDAVDLWGIEAQMLMVAEEATEVAHAVLKWRRAWKRYNSMGISLSREDLTETALLRNKAHERNLAKRVQALQTEAMQMLFMLDQVQIMHPGQYEDILQGVLNDARQRIAERQNRGEGDKR